ncbi:sigma-70 family RNA polymerase sigma factor [Mycobacterium deserti]|uniref:Sigma-70 family RNA polymerase sigma factor n=1 Tax=Mycobacterium deserti TaxID=2978347 RepID=A0ABT2MAY9_9MYCO|nr:sigma-70 family RNA polymerase sigma factor [Mycobacterium deserti]MCT7659429.1 sigma-70 family RNA polymerase sigma factor [Mycobacterium deserti]
MTALPEWDIVDPRSTDAELVRGSIAGDRSAFAQIYDRYADRLHDFCVGMLRDRDGAADCVQDVFCIAATRLPTLREPDKLLGWLYAIARNQALRRLRDQRREMPSDQLPDLQTDDAGPDALAVRAELADLIAEAAGGLTDRDRAVFDLAFRHGLTGPDLADAIGVSNSNANNVVQRLRRTVERSLGALLVSRRARSAPGDCTELDRLLATWDGQFTVLMRKRISRHIESCPTCDDKRRRLVSPAALLGSAPLLVPAPKWLRERTLGEIQLTSHGSSMRPECDSACLSGDDAGGRRRASRLLVAAALLLVGLGASVWLTFGWLKDEPVSITPTEFSEIDPEPASQVPLDVPSPPQAPAVGPPTPVLPAKTPPPAAPIYGPPSVSGPTPEVAPPIESPDPASTPEKSTVKPPMSFSPTVTAPPAAPPQLGGNDGPDSDQPNRANSAQ